MRTFARRRAHPSRRPSTSQLSGNRRARGRAGCSEPPLPEAGDYVTDGSSLFWVFRVLRNERYGKILVELEDCTTLDLILCSADALRRARVAAVLPSASS